MATNENVVGDANKSLSSEPLHAVQLLKSLVESSGPITDHEEEVSEQTISCRPESMYDFRRRLATFRASHWFNKPVEVSPIQCARRGLVNDGMDAVRCELCCVRGEWNARVTESSAASWLQNCHSMFCPWRCHEVIRADLAGLSDNDILEGFHSRLRGLQAMVAVPKLSESRLKEFPEDPLKVLAALGWEYAGDIGGHGRIEEHVQRIACTSCMRTIPVQSFSHQRVQKGNSTSPAGTAAQLVTPRSTSTPMDAVQRKRAAEAADLMRKRRKSGAKAESESSEMVAARIARSLSTLRSPREMESKPSGVSSMHAKEAKASSESTPTGFETPTRNLTKSTSDLSDTQSAETAGSVSQQILPPRNGLWVPSQRLQVNQTSDADFDPSYLHKWYCPWFSAPGEALSPLAERAVKLATQGCKSEQASTVTIERTGSLDTVGRAEELLRTLDQIMAPKS
jgi:hypothetical protein